MATRTEDRFGATTSLGTTYTSLFTGTSGHVYNLLVNVTNRTGSSANLQLFVAANSWTANEPTGGDLVAAIAYNLPIAAGDVVQVSGFVLKGTEKLIVRSSAATSLDITANGIDIVP